MKATEKKEENLCACGKPMHLSEAQTLILNMKGIAKTDCRPVTDGKTTWMVPIYYIVVHGLDLKVVPTLGFEQVAP